MTVPTDDTPNALPPFDRYRDGLTAAPVQVDVGPVTVDLDTDHPTHPVRVVFIPGVAVWATTPLEADRG